MDELEQIRRRLSGLPDSRGVLEGVLAFSPTALQVYAADGTSLLTNPAFRALFGSEPPPTYNLFRDEVAKAHGVDVLLRRAFAGEVVRVPALWYDPRDVQHVRVEEGRRVAVSCIAFPIRNGEGTVTHVVLAFRDETSEVRGREEAERRERRTRLLAEVSASLGESLDAEETLRQVLARAVTGFADWATATLLDDAGEQRRVAVVHRDPARQADCQRYLTGFPPPRHRATDEAQRLQSGRGIFMPEVTAEQLGGFAHDAEHLGVLHALGVASLILAPLTARGRTVGVVSFVRGPGSERYDETDVAFARELCARVGLAVDNARLFAAERALKVELEGAVRIRDEFLSVVAHELRTPLTALKLQLDAIRRRVAPTPEAMPPALRPRLSSLERQASRLTGLIDTMLDLSRITAGRLRLELTEVDLVPLVREAADRVQEAQDAAQASTLAVSAPDSVVGQWDATRLDQVITNLVTNAVKYGAERPIDVRVSATEAIARLEVQDHGIGIAREDQERIFGRFERAASTRHYSGLGLGLWITRQMVEAMGGTISVRSAPGEGSTFTVVLPRQPRSAPAGG